METVAESGDNLPPLGLGEKLLFGLWLFSILVVVALPLIGGYFGVCLLFGSDVVRSGVGPWATLIMVGIFVVWLVITHVIDLILRSKIPNPYRVLREAVSTIVGLLVLALFYLLLFNEATAALAAAVIASLLLLACAPLVNQLEKSAPDTR
ncbi:hypothetical protein [Arthrobacter rhombi]|uniref:hypothetical protein n=1 Tax=Arthrobacter rhombi TaxID=71253 RepID=UPI003FD2C404